MKSFTNIFNYTEENREIWHVSLISSIIKLLRRSNKVNSSGGVLWLLVGLLSIRIGAKMGRGWWWKVAVLAVVVAVVWRGWQVGGLEKESAFNFVREWSEKLGIWAIPLYVSLHTVSIALCLPSAIFFETAAPLLFGFLPSVFCVFSAKILAASLSFSIGRFTLSSSLTASITCALSL